VGPKGKANCGKKKNWKLITIIRMYKVGLLTVLLYKPWLAKPKLKWCFQ